MVFILLGPEQERTAVSARHTSCVVSYRSGSQNAGECLSEICDQQEAWSSKMLQACCCSFDKLSGELQCQARKKKKLKRNQLGVVSLLEVERLVEGPSIATGDKGGETQRNQRQCVRERLKFH